MVDYDTEVLTVAEVARMLKVGQPTVRRMLERNEIDGVKVGTRWRVRREKIMALIRGDTHATADSNKGTDDATSRGRTEACAFADRRATGTPEPDQRDGAINGATGGRDNPAEATTRVRLIKTAG